MCSHPGRPPSYIQARYFSSNPSDSGSLRTPCPPTSKLAGRRGITPAFGYSAPHPSAGGTLTLLILCAAQRTIRTHPPPSRLRPISRVRRLYGLPCSGDFAPGRGGLLQLLGMSLSPCCRFHPAKVNNRVSQSSVIHAAFAFQLEARPLVAFTFEATMRSLLLRPGDS